MLINFFFDVKKAKIPATIREFLMLVEAMDKRLVMYNIDDFYYLSRAALVKDEKYFDRYDRVFGAFFKGIEDMTTALFDGDIPEEWLLLQAEKLFSEEDKAAIEAMGGWEKLMEELRKRLEEQKERHQGGNRWIGTAGTSPFGTGGYNPEGVAIGQRRRRQGRALKVWDRRDYKNYDDNVQIGIRNIQLALRRLREFARVGEDDELDLDETIRNTAHNAGLLDIVMRPERRNRVKVLMFFDVGGSMDDHIRVCEELFSAARTEFKHLEYYYFHNFTYEFMWRDNRRRHEQRTPTWDVINTYPADYKVIFVGDAFMSPYEITYKGGSVEHWNEEPGLLWAQRMLDQWPNAIWLNPRPETRWEHTPSTMIVKEVMANRMFPLSIDGLDRGLRLLTAA
ncbi:MAG: VWA domain-containing protein [Alphaproteobacteria bacterium]|nr:VWA domain-containing protein [Alphaproteobacteria bacterium]MCY4230577.1 VWA domain-containing protein [Alphaproteobacteria bacterium]